MKFRNPFVGQTTLQIMVFALLFTTVFARADSSMLQSNDPLVARHLGAGLDLIGLTATVYAFFTMLVRIFYSARLELTVVPRVLRHGFGIMAVAIATIMASPNIIVFLIGVALAGVATALFMPHLLSLVAALSMPEERENNLSYYSLALSISLVIAPILGTIILAHASIRVMYGLLLAFAIGAYVISWRIQQPLLTELAHKSQGSTTATKKPSLLAMVRTLWTNTHYMSNFWALLLYNISFVVTLSYVGVDLRTKFHLHDTTIELLFTGYFLVSFGIRILMTRLSRQKKLGRKVLWMFSSLAIGAAGLVLMGTSPGLGLFFSGFLLMAAPHALVFPLASMRISQAVERSELVAANTLAQSSFDLTGVVSPLIFGLIVSHSSFTAGYDVVAVLQMLAMTILFKEARRVFRVPVRSTPH